MSPRPAHFPSDLALRQLRNWKATNTKRHSAFTATGLAKSAVKPKAAITLRRAEYDKKRDGEE